MTILERPQPIVVFDETEMGVVPIVSEAAPVKTEDSNAPSELASNLTEPSSSSFSSSAVETSIPTRRTQEEVEKMNLGLQQLSKEMQTKASMTTSALQHPPLPVRCEHLVKLTKEEAASITLKIKSVLFQTPPFSSPPSSTSPSSLSSALPSISRNGIQYGTTRKHANVVLQPREFVSSPYSDALPRRYPLTHSSSPYHHYQKPPFPKNFYHPTHHYDIAQSVCSFNPPAMKSYSTNFINKKSAGAITGEIKRILGI